MKSMRRLSFCFALVLFCELKAGLCIYVGDKQLFQVVAPLNTEEMLKEYIPAGETRENWTRLASVRVFKDLKDPKEYLVSAAKKVVQNDPSVRPHFNKSNDTQPLILDYVLSPRPNQPHSEGEWNLVRAKYVEGTGLVVYQYVLRLSDSGAQSAELIKMQRMNLLDAFFYSNFEERMVEEPKLIDKMTKLAASGNLAELEKLFDAGTSIYEADMFGHTVAYHAAQSDNWKIVERLFARGYDPLAVTQGRKGHPEVFQRGLEILPQAAAHGRVDWVKRLLALGVVTDARTATGAQEQDPLCLALLNKHADVANLLLDFGCPLDDAQVPVGGTDARFSTMGAIHLAVRNQDTNILSRLLKMGADIDRKNSMGITPLMFAASYNWNDGIELLLSQHASLTLQDVGKNDVWTYADPYPEVRQTLTRGKLGVTKNQLVSPESELILGIDAGDMLAVRRLLQTPRLANGMDSKGVPILFYAVHAGRPELLQVLLAAHANPNKQTADGGSALSEAVASGQQEIARLLLEAGADPNIYSPTGWSPLERAIQRKEFETAKLLLGHGAHADSDVHSDYASGRAPPICHAARVGNLEILQMLLEKGANLQAVDDDGIGALLYACESGNPAVTEFLVAHGLNINVVAPNGNTPLAIAVACGDAPMVKMALRLGAKPVALERAISELARGNPHADEIITILKAADTGAVSEAAFWSNRPSRTDIMTYITSGGNPNYAGGKTPLFEALYAGDFELADFLLHHGADPNLSGHVHGSPLWALIAGTRKGGEEKAVEVATKMLRLGANPDGNPKKENLSVFGAAPPLAFAVEQGYVGLVDVLLRYGAGVAAGRTAWEDRGGKLSPDVQNRIRVLLEKSWAKPQKI